ncbi:hypothetical protein [Heliorestis convoluta]|uniref:Uncharacterized protein n=1 Tax=Heliorestis convoluta TaxID=356322 RepID=A0A5Q2MXY5_9FIRM|nr:hypothetical protein [Heliorestis convoluta]QGG46751.1 hypothetical protein FTV88_0572 [Heliorestis convoluta]
MRGLMSVINQLEVRGNAEERLIYQLVDLSVIKYRGEQENAFTPEIEKALENVIRGFIWLYEKGLSLESNPRDHMNASEEAFYDQFLDDFSLFNDFMRKNMHLKPTD